MEFSLFSCFEVGQVLSKVGFAYLTLEDTKFLEKKIEVSFNFFKGRREGVTHFAFSDVFSIIFLNFFSS